MNLSEKFLLDLKWTKRAQYGVFLSFHEIFSVLFTENKLDLTILGFPVQTTYLEKFCLTSYIAWPYGPKCFDSMRLQNSLIINIPGRMHRYP